MLGEGLAHLLPVRVCLSAAAWMHGLSSGKGSHGDRVVAGTRTGLPGAGGVVLVGTLSPSNVMKPLGVKLPVKLVIGLRLVVPSGRFTSASVPTSQVTTFGSDLTMVPTRLVAWVCQVKW